MSGWLIWLVIAVALGVGELLTLTFVLGMFSFGAGAAAVAAALGAGGAIDGVTFGVVSLAGLAFVLPTARRHRHGPTLRTGTAALVGKRGRTTTEVSVGDAAGRVMIGGEEWSAAPYDDTIVIPAGTWIDVLEINGATAVIHPLELPLGGSGTES